MTLNTDADVPISVGVTPTFAEYLRFNFWAIFRLLPVVAAFAVLLPLASLFIVLFSLTRGTGEVEYHQLLPAMILPAVVFVILPVVTYLGAKRRWRDVAALRETRTFTFTNSGVRSAGETFEGFIAWSNITSAKRVGLQVLLTVGKQQFYLIPLRAFGNDDVWEQFRRLVVTKVSDCRL